MNDKELEKYRKGPKVALQKFCCRVNDAFNITRKTITNNTTTQGTSTEHNNDEEKAILQQAYKPRPLLNEASYFRISIEDNDMDKNTAVNILSNACHSKMNVDILIEDTLSIKDCDINISIKKDAPDFISSFIDDPLSSLSPTTAASASAACSSGSGKKNLNIYLKEKCKLVASDSNAISSTTPSRLTTDSTAFDFSSLQGSSKKHVTKLLVKSCDSYISSTKSSSSSSGGGDLTDLQISMDEASGSSQSQLQMIIRSESTSSMNKMYRTPSMIIVSSPDDSVFNDDDDNHIRTTRTCIRLSRVEDRNNMGDWSITKAIYHLSDEKSRKCRANERMIYGSMIPLELHDQFLENEKILFCQTRNNRRHAIHIYDGKELKRELNSYMIIKDFCG